MCENVFFSITFFPLDNLSEKAYNTDMERYQMVRIWKHTHHTLRKIAVFTGESLVEALERMANEEWQRVQQKAENKPNASRKKNQN